ncbi:MAG: acylneuraminate cytidylyltransferase family protein [Acidobacteria bacterium]|nr:acylneuraminate cytidylyltransferase family protein [Acidobacteriota bacterium]
MIVLGVIPARGGSKGIPGKNLAPVAGRPLIAWTCDAARASRLLTHVAVSTDDERIADAARARGVETVLRRPAPLSADDTPMLPVLRHALAEFERTAGPVETVVLLQPTSPLRRGEHIDAAVRLLRESGADCVVSVVPVPHQFSPVSLMSLDAGSRLSAYEGGATAVRRQDKPALYAMNGPAVLAIRREALLSGDSLYAGDCRALVMRSEDSIDVDTAWDLDLAAFALQRRTS